MNNNGPFPKPFSGKPCETPIPDAPPVSRPAPVAADCHCDAHSNSPRVDQYRQVMEREHKLCQDYDHLRRQMVDVTNDILDHPCDDLETKMRILQQATLQKRSVPITDYQPIKPASQSSAPIPTQAHRLGVLTSFKDPTHFSENPPVVRPTIHPPGVVHTGVCPQSIQTWFADYPVRSEYMDTFSAAGKAVLRSMQRYKEPLPSTRRRADDTCV